VALLQLPVSADKSTNLSTAREYVIEARESGASLCVLPEIWNSPYATAAFPDYAEAGAAMTMMTMTMTMMTIAVFVAVGVVVGGSRRSS